jgi:hypothetical protein
MDELGTVKFDQRLRTPIGKYLKQRKKSLSLQKTTKNRF